MRMLEGQTWSTKTSRSFKLFQKYNHFPQIFPNSILTPFQAQNAETAVLFSMMERRPLTSCWRGTVVGGFHGAL